MPRIRLIGGTNRVKPRTWTLESYLNRRNRILIRRCCGGLGDLFMHRMVFEDFKLLCPDIHITFACPKEYHQTVEDHPFIDELVDHDEVDISNFLAHYDTSTICGQVEMAHAPRSGPHRSDIWANACGIELTRHDMHFRISEVEKRLAKEQLDALGRKGKSVLVAPISAISSKNLDCGQWGYVLDELQAMGYFVFGLHKAPIQDFDAPQLVGKNIRNFMALVDAADYVIAVDSAAFHMSGGLGKPMVGVFGWSDGLVYGKYYPSYELVQRHRDYTPGWDCGPCYTWGNCPKSQANRKPCIIEITGNEIVQAFKKLLIRFPAPLTA